MTQLSGSASQSSTCLYACQVLLPVSQAAPLQLSPCVYQCLLKLNAPDLSCSCDSSSSCTIKQQICAVCVVHPVVCCHLQIQTQLANHVAAVGPAILVGIACGVLATVFTVLNIKVVRLRDTIIQVSTAFPVCTSLAYGLFLTQHCKACSSAIVCFPAGIAHMCPALHTIAQHANVQSRNCTSAWACMCLLQYDVNRYNGHSHTMQQHVTVTLTLQNARSIAPDHVTGSCICNHAYMSTHT